MVTLVTILEDIIASEFGTETLASVHALCPALRERLSSAPMVEDVEQLLDALAQVRKTTPVEMYRSIGETIAPVLLKRSVEVLRAHESMRSFLLDLNGLPVTRAHAWLPSAEMPYFDLEFMSPDVIRVSFSGSLEGRAALEGLLMGCARALEERIELHPVPMETRPNRRIVDVKLEPERRATPRMSSGARKSETPPRGR